MDPRRLQRVTETLREELTEILALELEDPRLAGIEVVDTQLSPDGKKVVVQVIIPGSKQRQEQALLALATAKSFIKREISSRLELFRTPELYFDAVLDPALAAKRDYLLRKIRKGRPRPQPEENSQKNPEA